MTKAKSRADKKSVLTLKFVGGAILLLSAIFQNFIYDAVSARSDELYNAARDRALIDKGGLIHEADYYILSLKSDELSQKMAIAHLKFFALKLYQSQVINVVVASQSTNEQKQEYLSALQKIASGVENYQDVIDLTQFIATRGNRFDKQIDAEQKNLSSRRSLARLIFLLSYLAGSAIVMVGAYQERSLVDAE